MNLNYFFIILQDLNFFEKNIFGSKKALKKFHIIEVRFLRNLFKIYKVKCRWQFNLQE